MLFLLSMFVEHLMTICVFFFNDTATTEIYTDLHTLSLHDALPIYLITMGTQFPEHMGMFPGADATWPEERLDELADATGIGRWGVRTALWGDEPVVEHHLSRIREAWAAVEGGRVDVVGRFTPENWGEISTFMQKISAGIPTMEMMEQMPDWVGHVGFSPIVPLQGDEVVRMVERIKERVVARTGANFVCAIFPTNDRSAMIVSAMSFDRRD